MFGLLPPILCGQVLQHYRKIYICVDVTGRLSCTLVLKILRNNLDLITPDLIIQDLIPILYAALLLMDKREERIRSSVKVKKEILSGSNTKTVLQSSQSH